MPSWSTKGKNLRSYLYEIHRKWVIMSFHNYSALLKLTSSLVY
uniref:Uncharacterized protein n=1 Tax=Rhizophora mucronata TaxID=61149 RepID=A0A2P2R3B4_RHIMU